MSEGRHDDALAAALRRMAAQVSDGTHQRERFPVALRGDYFQVDETTPEDLVALDARYARQLRFIGLDNRESHRWSELFDTDEALLLARIVSPDRGERGDHRQLMAALQADVESIAPLAMAQEIVRLAGVIDHWLRCLRHNDGAAAQALARALVEIVRGRLALPLQRVLARLGAQRWRGSRVDHGAAALDAVWGLQMTDLPDNATPLDAPDVAPARELLRTALALFMAALERLRELAREHLAASQGSGVHEPAAALLLSFMHLYGTLREHINGFTARHTDFYYDEVLRMRALPATPDQVHLVATREPGAARDPVLQRGTLFAAGKDAAGGDILFRADDELSVGEARVAALCTLRLERDPLISPEYELDFVNRAHASRLPEAVATPAGRAPPYFPLFGGNEQQVASAAEPACFGVAVASAQLLAQEGDRTITLSLSLAEMALSDARLDALVRQHAAAVAAGAGDDDLLGALFQAYAELERQPPPPGACSAAALASASSARVAALPAAQRDSLHYFRLFLLQRALHGQGQGFRFACGRLLAHWLLSSPQPGLVTASSGEPQDWLAEPDRLALKAVAARQFGDAGPQEGDFALRIGDPLSLVFGAQRPDRDLVFARLFTGLFAASVSADHGWHRVAEAYVVQPETPPRPGAGGLQVVLRLRPGDPPVVGCDAALHGAAWATTLPLVQLRLQPFGGLFAYSLFESARLVDITLTVTVAGLRGVVLHNNLGRVDPGKPFTPFGPLPQKGSYLMLGSPELSRKQLTALSLNLRWGGLPPEGDGFAAHYAGYPAGIDNASFRVDLSVLRDGQWQPQSGLPASQRLFAVDRTTGRLVQDNTISVDPVLLRHHFRAADAPPPGVEPVFDLGARNGLVRLQLSQPEGAFGHADYAGLLTQVVSANARRRRQAAVPRPPYTPVIDSLDIDYQAQQLIRLDGAAAPERGAAPDRVYQLHPWGLQTLLPRAADTAACRLLPRYRHDGHLFIGLAAPTLPSRLTLLFQLRDESAVPRPGPSGLPQWWVLVRDQWQLLPASQVLADGTAGFLTSGIVVLDLPVDIDDRHSVMPDGLFWLAVGVDTGFAGFAGLYGVHAHALRATRAAGAADAPPPQTLPPGSVGMPVASLPGLASLRQIGASFGLRAAEDRRQMHTRAGERLRHKQRACLPWDYERLALEACPDICKVKCFTASELPGAAPGLVLLAVLPAPHRFDRAAGTLYPRLNAIELARIAERIAALCPPSAMVRVRNAAYERVQLRCAVALQPGAPVGASLQRIDRAIFDYISPWCEGGLEPRFGWVLRQEDIEASLRTLDCVDFVTGLSMLNIAEDDDGFHTLIDTAAAHRPGAAGAAAATAADTVQRVELRPLRPWSIAVPMAAHMVRIVAGGAGAEPRVTGITDLSIGSNFIIGGADHG